MAPSRRTLVGAGLTALGIAGGIAARQAVRHGEADLVWPDPPEGTEVHEIAAADGAALRVVARGAGPAVLLLHGITLSSQVWHHQLDSLPALGLRVVIPDLRGHGASVPGSGGLRLGRMADDVGDVIDALELRDVVLVGHSMGGMVALQFLGRRRRSDVSAAAAARVVGLGLVATSAHPSAWRGVPGGLAVAGLARPVLTAVSRLSALLPGPSLPDSAVGDPLARLTFGDDADPEAVTTVRRITAAVPARTSVELLAQLATFDMRPVLGGIDLPTTVVVGTADVITPPAHARDLAAAIPGAELDILEGCGHMVMLERPAELDTALADLARRAGALAPSPPSPPSPLPTPDGHR